MIAGALVAVSVLAAQPLPPGHPPVNDLPPGHPSLDQPAAASELPPGHPSVGPGEAKAPSMKELLEKLDAAKDLKTREKTFEVATALAKLFYANVRYDEAAEYFAQALQKAEPARTLLLEQRKKVHGALPSLDQAGCAPNAQSTLDSQTAIAREKAKAGDAAAAVACLQAALEPAAEVHRLRATALYLRGDSAGALAELDRSIEVTDRDAEALLLRGEIRFDGNGDDVKTLAQAKRDIARSLELAPMWPRAAYAKDLVARIDAAIAAGGISKLDAKEAAADKAKGPRLAAAPPMMNAPFANMGRDPNAAPPPLSKDVVDAIQNTERTPELEAGLQKLVEEGEDDLAHGKFQDALDAYKRVVPFQPENGRAKAGMAWSLVGMNRQPMADRVWMVAVQADVAAVDKLGDTLKAKGDAAGAKALWTKLAESAPDYAPKLQAKLQ